MSDEERFKIIQQMRDRIISIKDGFRFDSQSKPGRNTQENFDKLDEAEEMLDTLSKDYIDTMPCFSQILAAENTIIENEKTVEVKTNITGLSFDPEEEELEIIFDGSIPSEGFLKMSTDLTLGYIRFFATNKVPQQVSDEYDLCGYHFCDPKTTRYFGPGIYRIEKGQVIGTVIRHVHLKMSKETLEFTNKKLTLP